MQTIRTNLNINASTQYTKFNHVAMCQFNGLTLGAGPSGLFKCICGDTDDSVDIDAYFIPYTVDFDDNHPKRLRRVYIGGKFDGDMNLTVTGNGKSINGPYTIKYNVGETKQVKMFPIDRGLGYKWVYADFKFENVDGSYFAVDSILAIYSTHARRRN